MSSPAVQPLLALLACPVGGNPTQYLVERAFARGGLDWRYLSFEVPPESLDGAVRGLRALGFRGAHCGDPHKQAVLPLLDRVTETAAMVGAVNFIFRDADALVGDNTEGMAVVETIRRTLDPAGKQIVILGAGRMAKATAVALAAAGAAGLAVINRTESRAAELAALIRERFPSVQAAAAAWAGEYAVPPEVEILIHATSLFHDSSEASLPLAADSLRPELLVVDATANAPQTWLLQEAGRRGCKTIDGLVVFLEQAAIGLQLWTGVNPDRAMLQEAAEEFLGL
jgi:shikimate dehydrogenase